MNSYEHELRVACELARAAGAALLEHYEGPLKIAKKHSEHDTELLTQADTIANDLIVGHLKREFPNDGILAEESVDTMSRLEKARVWMVDPLDGTNGFIDGNGDFAVQIGLTEDGQCVLGVVFQPLPGVMYRAIHDAGQWLKDDAKNTLTVFGESDLNCEIAVAVDEAVGAVERIDHPHARLLEAAHRVD